MGENVMKKKIYIAIPNMGNIATDLVVNLVRWSHSTKHTIKINAPYGLFPLDNARNTIVKDFLETDYDYIWWIDDDIVPPFETLDRLIQADKDVIGAVCFSMKAENGEYFPYPVTLRYNDEKRYQVYYGSGIEEVDAIGGACVLVKRRVYESIERPYEFVYHRDGTLALTCDFRVWQKLQELGFKVFVDFDILCDHKKTCSIMGIQNLMVSLKKED
jgi:hypothetical protein